MGFTTRVVSNIVREYRPNSRHCQIANLTPSRNCAILSPTSETRRCLRSLTPLARVAHQPIGLVHLSLYSEREI
jgi:hypothetical protein